MQKTDKELMWTEVKCEHIVKDEWMDLCRVRYRFPDGREFEPYYRYSRKDYAVIAAEDEKGRLICVRQFRYGIGKVTVEFPAGGIDREGDTEYAGPASGGASESALEAAKRELQEETGYVSDNWQHLLTIPSNATVADNYAHIFFAGKCRKVSGQNLDDTEYLEPLLLTPEEVEENIQNGAFAQAVHVMTWLMAKPLLSR